MEFAHCSGEAQHNQIGIKLAVVRPQRLSAIFKLGQAQHSVNGICEIPHCLRLSLCNNSLYKRFLLATYFTIL
ncbi:unnamed protein product [Nippostrongylus brasiliensis]|uniref:Uncharacterized protein n=1 Tax=Nippostrongylus brasiliensis TaxID=27835 RepID=A0A0N4XR95_NIPBR|nr:unnamed protein product [Nippostrongylus brasiliensis]